MQLGVRLNHQELAALKGLPLAARVVYSEGIRPFMDYATGVVGAPGGRAKRISLQSLSEVLFVEPAPNRRQSGSPSRKQVRQCVTQLIDAGLLSSLSTTGKGNNALILKCNLADTDQSVSKKLGTDWAQDLGTDWAQYEASHSNGLGNIDNPELGTPETPELGTPPDPVITDTTPRAPAREALLIPDNFHIDETVRARLVMGGVRLAVAEFLLDEFKAANESSGFTSMSWPAEFVKYCKRWEWRYDKEHGSSNETSKRDSQQRQSRSSKVHEREKRLYQEAVAREQGAEDIYPTEGTVRPQVVVPYRGRGDA